MAKLTNTGTANNAAFGQYGSIHAHDAESAVVPPDGMIFCAIQFLDDTSFHSLVSEDPIGLEFAQHHGGQVLTASAANDNFFLDQDTTSDLVTDATMAVGDYVYHEDGNFLGKVSLIGRNKADGADDTSGFHLDRDPGSDAVLDDDILTIIKPASGEGGGSSDLDNGVVFPKGLTIYGSWRSFSLKTAAATAGVVAYLAPANGPQAT